MNTALTLHHKTVTWCKVHFFAAVFFVLAAFGLVALVGLVFLGDLALVTLVFLAVLGLVALALLGDFAFFAVLAAFFGFASPDAATFTQIINSIVFA